MKNYTIHLPCKVYMGVGQVERSGQIVAEYGKRALLVTTKWDDVQGPCFSHVKKLLEDAGVTVTVYDGITSNPNTYSINAASEMAKDAGCDVIVGLGGGSSIDAAKAIAVGTTHEGVAWDYVYTNGKPVVPEKVLPIVAITTVTGTGAHVTPFAVFSNEDLKIKSTIIHDTMFARAAVVDPALTVTLPRFVTATTGFDAFSHLFESYTNKNANPFIDSLCIEAMSIIISNLETVLDDPKNLELRDKMCYAETLGGVAIANSGTTLPHAMGQPISGKCPYVSHGQSLTLVYPEFIRFSYKKCTDKFAAVARMMDPSLSSADDFEAAEALNGLIVGWQKRLGIFTSLEELKVPFEHIETLVRDTMNCGDTYAGPAVPTADEVRQMYLNMWQQKAE